jgi:hypothetical protein
MVLTVANVGKIVALIEDGRSQCYVSGIWEYPALSFKMSGDGSWKPVHTRDEQDLEEKKLQLQLMTGFLFKIPILMCLAGLRDIKPFATSRLLMVLSLTSTPRTICKSCLIFTAVDVRFLRVFKTMK